MYCKLVTKPNITALQLATDLIGILTSAYTSTAALVSGVVANCEMVAGAQAAWTFVHKLCDTTTRQHFVLTGVDDAGIQITLGIILTSDATNISFDAWMCGPYSATNKRPLAYDVTGWGCAGNSPAAHFTEAGERNGYHFISHSSGVANPLPVAMGPVDGTLTLVVSSIAGNTMLSRHYGAVHAEVLEVYSIDRELMGRDGNAALFPFPIVFAYNHLKASGDGVKANMIGPDVSAQTSNANYRGLTLGVPITTTVTTLTAPLSDELGHNKIHGQGQYSATYGYFQRTMVKQTGGVVLGYPSKVDAALLTRAMPPKTFSGLTHHQPDTFVSYAYPKYCPSYMGALDTPTDTVLNPFDEVVAGSDTWVAIGRVSTYSRSHYKG